MSGRQYLGEIEACEDSALCACLSKAHPWALLSCSFSLLQTHWPPKHGSTQGCSFAFPSAWNALPSGTRIGCLLASFISLFNIHQIMQCKSSPALLSASYFATYVFHSPLSPSGILLYLFMVCPQIRKMDVILFTLLPKHMGLGIAHGGGPINICSSVVECYLSSPKFFLPFGVQIYSLCCINTASLGKLTCTFMSKACFLSGTQRSPVEGIHIALRCQ